VINAQSIGAAIGRETTGELLALAVDVIGAMRFGRLL